MISPFSPFYNILPNRYTDSYHLIYSISKISLPPLQLLEQLSLPSLHPLNLNLQLIILTTDHTSPLNNLNRGLVIHLPLLLLDLLQLLLQLSILSQQITRDDLVLMVLAVLFVQKDLLKVLKLVLDGVIGLH